MVVFARDLARHGVRTDDGLYTAVLYSIIGHISFALFLVPALLWLAVTRQLPGRLLLGAAVLGAVLALVLTPLAVVHRQRGASVRRVRWLHHRLRAFVERARAHGVRPRDLAAPLLLAVGVHGLNAAMLYCCLRAVGLHPLAGTVLGGYAAGTLFGLLAPIYQGVGVVELTTTSALHRAGVPLAAALAATLLYRLTQFWLPLAAGVSVQLREFQTRIHPAPRRAALSIGAMGIAVTVILLVIVDPDPSLALLVALLQ